ncbi:hypothetical protein GGF37_000820 [Kickxella alabastrina]|nr:hypothetical protein GGF37_000820 [Kickxella alabastrina]
MSGLLAQDGQISGIVALQLKDNFKLEMARLFSCREMVRVASDEHWFKFTYTRQVDLSYLTSYLQPFVDILSKEDHRVEIELRIKLGSRMFNDTLKLLGLTESSGLANNYQTFKIHLSDQHLRKYESGAKSLKVLLFRKKEVVLGSEYYVCLSAEKDVLEDMTSKEMAQSQVKMKRWEVKTAYGAIHLSDRQGQQKDLEIEFTSPGDIVWARRYMVSLIRQVKNRIVMQGRDDVLVFGVRGLGQWEWDSKQQIKHISHQTGNNVVIRARRLKDGRLIFKDLVNDKMTCLARKKLLKVIEETWQEMGTMP